MWGFCTRLRRVFRGSRRRYRGRGQAAPWAALPDLDRCGGVGHAGRDGKDWAGGG